MMSSENSSDVFVYGKFIQIIENYDYLALIFSNFLLLQVKRIEHNRICWFQLMESYMSQINLMNVKFT